MTTYNSNWDLGTFEKEQETLDVCWSVEGTVLNSYKEALAFIEKRKDTFPKNKEHLSLKKTYFKMGHMDAHFEELVLNPNYLK